MKYGLLLNIIILFTGCASITRQSESLYDNTTDHNIQRAAHTTKVPFILQKQDHCGPATLTMNLNWLGANVSTDQITKEIFNKAAKGTFKSDMVFGAKTFGYVPVRISKLTEMFNEIAEGNPVIVFQNLGFNWYPLWHYSLIHGYDLESKKIYMHSGEDQNKELDIIKFERSWNRGGYWAIVLKNPGVIAKVSTQAQNIRAAVFFEKMSMNFRAQKHYHAIIEKWPKSPVAYFGLANINLEEKKFKQARKYLETATQLKNDFAQAWFNLTLLYSQENQITMARAAAIKAVAFASPKQKASFEKKLAQWL